MKKNKKGFIMVETIIVSSVVLAALVFIYIQFTTVSNNYYRSFKYNSVDDLYKVNNIKTFIVNSNYNVALALTDDDYIDITSCSADDFTEYPYCKTLFDALDIQTVIITKENISGIDFSNLSLGMNNFIKTIKDNGNGYRIIVEFEDSYATLKVGGNI